MAIIASNGTGGGLASAGASWAGGVAPVDGDKVNILNGDTITMDVTTLQWGDDTTTGINIKSGGILKASRIANSQLRCKGSLVIESGGTFDTGKNGDIIPAAYTFKLLANYSDVLASNKYPFTLLSGGKWFSWGATKTINTKLNGALAIGATSAVLEDVTGWKAGDDIVFACTDTYVNYTRWDARTITTINTGTKTITFTATTYAHADRCEVGNFTSNVTYTNYDNTYTNRGSISCALGNLANLLEIQYTSFYKTANSGVVAFQFTGAGANNPIISFANNTFFNNHGSSGVINLQQAQQYINFNGLAFFTNETAVNANGSDIFTYGGTTNCSFSNNVHYGRTNGSLCSSGGSQGGVGITFTNCIFISANGNGMSCTNGVTVNSCYFFSVTQAMSVAYSSKIYVNNSYIGVGRGTPSLGYAFAGSYAADLVFTDCYFSYLVAANASNAPQYTMLDGYKVIFSNKNVDPSAQEIYTGGGNFFRDNSTFKTGIASLRYDRIVSAIKAANVQFYIFAPTGKPITVSGYLRKNSSYGSSTLPYVTLSGLGITISSSTMTDVNDTWVQFTVSGTQTTGTDGMLTLTAYFQSANANASAWIDGVSAPTPVAVNSGDFGYWAVGQPVGVITANFVAPVDVWNTLKSNVTLPGSMGVEVNTINSNAGLIPALL